MMKMLSLNFDAVRLIAIVLLSHLPSAAWAMDNGNHAQPQPAVVSKQGADENSFVESEPEALLPTEMEGEAGVQRLNDGTLILPANEENGLSPLEKLRIFGTAFLNVSKQWQPERSGGEREYGIGVGASRFYIGVRHEFGDAYAAEFLSDIGRNIGGKYGIFVKRAYVEADWDEAIRVRLGSESLPWVPYVQGKYDYRYVERAFLTRLGFGASTDWGLHLSGKVGVISYALSGVNGKGYGDPSRARHSPDGEVRISLEHQGFYGAVGGYLGHLGAETPAPRLAKRLNGIAGYSGKGFGLGVEYFLADNWNIGAASIISLPLDRAEGYSLKGTLELGDFYELFGRFERAALSEHESPGRRDTYWHAGVQYRINKALRAAFVFKWNRVDSGKGERSDEVALIGGEVETSRTVSAELGFWLEYGF